MPEFERVDAPGLPTWPRLLLDKQRRRAIVTFRVATWRSCEHAHFMSACLAWVVMIATGWLMWRRLEFVDHPVVQGLLTLLGASLARAFAQRLLPAALDEFLARKLFARRSTVWFTPETIAFRSQLYDNGVVVPRSWRGSPVQVRFDTGPDPEAAAELDQPPGQRGHSPGLQTARVLRMVISAFDPERIIARSTPGLLARAIPMLPLDVQDAQRLTVVLTAAAELTAPSPGSVPTAQPVPGPTAGLDIDA